MKNLQIPDLCGLGLRSPHYEEIIQSINSDSAPKIAWFEMHSENFFSYNKYLHNILDKISQHYPLSFHTVGLSLGSSDRLNINHLSRLKEIVDLYKPHFVSEHLSWSSVEDVALHDLLPAPYSKDSLDNFCNKIDQVQNYLGRQILIENPALYLTFPESIMQETDFINTICHNTNCGILLDLNNLYISSKNLNFDAKHYLHNLENKLVQEIHLAGYEISPKNNLLIDTHSNKTSNNVLNLFEYFIKKYGVRPILFEQDQEIPSLKELELHIQNINTIML